MPRAICTVEAPSILGLRPTGVEDLPRALRAAGLHARLAAERHLDVPAMPYDGRRDPATGMLNAGAIAEYTGRLAAAVGSLLDDGKVPLVLGGDCTILLGNLLALARRGRYGLLFVDGHADFYQPAANVNGEAASSELAFATGRGPTVLTTFDGRCPLIHDEDVVALGVRDTEESQSYHSQPLPSSMRCYDLGAIRRIGAAAAIDQARDHFRQRNVDGIWVHFDVDVLADDIMPAVDYRLPGGLTWDEADVLLSRAWSDAAVIGMDVTIFNPRLDADGSIAASLVAFLARVLGARVSD
jgi:arginase